MSRGRTPLFRKLMQAVEQARWLNANPDKQQLFYEAREASRVSRRVFVRLVGAAGFATAAGGLLPRTSLAQEPAEAVPAAAAGPVAILGAGIAGLTAAY